MKKAMTVVMVALIAAGVGWAADPIKMKMTTEIPPGIATPHSLMFVPVLVGQHEPGKEPGPVRA